MRELFQKNRKAAIMISAAVGFLLLASILSACQLEDLIQVDVPKPVSDAIQTEERVSVADSAEVWEEWVAWVDRQSSRLEAEIGQAQERAAVVRSLTDMSISLGQDAASTLPGGAFISTGLALMGGLFLKRPGDKKREQMEKEDSYTAGLEKGREIASAVRESVEALSSQRDHTNG